MKTIILFGLVIAMMLVMATLDAVNQFNKDLDEGTKMQITMGIVAFFIFGIPTTILFIKTLNIKKDESNI